MNELAEKIAKLIEQYDEDLNAKDFAEAIAQVVKEDYGAHNYNTFITALEIELYREPEDDGFAF